MSVIADLLIGLASAFLFALLEPYLLGLAPPWKWASAVAVLIGAGVIAHLLRRAKPDSSEKARQILTGNNAGEDMEIIANNVDATGSQGAVLAENKAEGKVKINISDSKF
ncbi:hypothetical protein K2X14_13795 [Acetobacter sp. TBRC 12305]|uniref:Uncharacterized protein n=1 Tax=Acetobacter garciniae TaxID=2817435 RepID=A0A939HR23_9PROT|nr:hypothetical protein [Acetobacter garciniae]MBO1326011.1 hypothetical protein [Acetobacter garciniae]MBX0345911.1 hypothetical protein [Acetobacter garciniae]